MHVDQGSTINLTCVSKFNPTTPSDVTWYLNGKVSLSPLEIDVYVNFDLGSGSEIGLVHEPSLSLFSYLQKIDYDSPRGGVSVVIEKAKWTTSHLLIQRATSKDSGIYKCAPLNAVTASINLHVLRGTGCSILFLGH